eukprot:1158576-Pelagomonas_calceolata.AAC.3
MKYNPFNLCKLERLKSARENMQYGRLAGKTLPSPLHLKGPCPVWHGLIVVPSSMISSGTGLKNPSGHRLQLSILCQRPGNEHAWALTYWH